MKKIALWFLCIGLILVVLAGCSKDKKPTPQERFQAYIDDWQKQNFTAMYNRLSTKTKEKVSKEEFVDRYKKLYDAFEVSDLSVKGEFKQKKQEDIDTDEDGKVELPFTVKMKTMAGPVKFKEKATISKEEREEDKPDWFINWNTKMIFPEMTDPSIKVYAKTTPAKRGEMIDRKGNPLAVDGKVASIGIWPEKLESGSKQKLADETGIPLEDIEKKLGATWVKKDSFVQITRLPEDNDKQIAKLMKIPGVTKHEDPARVYPYHKAMGHLTGYIGGITADQLKKLKDKGYDKNDMIGRRGLEQLYENRLRGKDGAEIYTADADKNRLETIAKTEPKNGETIQLTINADLQKKLYHQMKNKEGKFDAGSAAAIDPKTGQVLALVSTPSYDPNEFVLGISTKDYQALQKDSEKPLFNRFKHTYAPGSSFKPITAAIALKTNTIDPNEERTINTQQWQPEDSNWGKIHVTRLNHTPKVNLEKALVYSDNIYFAQTALKIGADNFLKEGKKFGLGEKMPFTYPIEKGQLTSGGKFDSEIQLANSGYGQGQVEVSALQLAIDYTPFVNHGNLLQPSLELNQSKDESNVWHKNIISDKIASTIKKDLIQVVETPGGTGREAKIDGLTIAGKTGTAELKKGQDIKNGKENGWFVGFNTKDPKLLIAMMVENVQKDKRGAINGSHYVVPKVANVLKEYLK